MASSEMDSSIKSNPILCTPPKNCPKTPDKSSIISNKHEDHSGTFKEHTHLELLLSSSSLLPLHSLSETCQLEELERYFLSLNKQIVSTSEAKKFWTEAHYFSALRHFSFCSSPRQTRLDFRWDDSTFSSSSSSVNEALGLSILDQKMNQSVLLLRSVSNAKTSTTSNLFSLTAALSNLSLIKTDAGEMNQNNEKKASEYIAERVNRISSFTTSTISKTPFNTPSSRYSITGTPKKIASAVARGISGRITSILASYDIVDDPEYYDNTNRAASENDCTTCRADYEREILEQDEKLVKLKNFQPALDEDIVLNIDLAVDCCFHILNFIKLVSNSTEVKDAILPTNNENDDNLQFLVIQDKIMVYRLDQTSSKISWTSFCRYVGFYYLSNSNTTTTKNDTDNIFHWKKQAHFHLLSQINTADASLLADSLLSMSAIQSNPDNTILFFFIKPNFPTSLSSQPKPLSLPALSQVDIALFDMTSTKISLLKRINNLSLDIEKCKQDAVNHYKLKNTKLASIQLQKRKIKSAQLDRYASTLLNIEMALESLHQSLSDLEMKQTLETCRDAMKIIRETNDGYDCDHVDEVMEDLKESMDGVQMVGNIMAEDITAFGDGIDLEKELKDLEIEMEEDRGGGFDNGGLKKQNVCVEALTPSSITKNVTEQNSKTSLKENVQPPPKVLAQA